MSDLYEKVSHPVDRPKRRRGAAVFIALAAAVAIIALWVMSAYGILSVRPTFYKFVAAISDSTVYAYNHNSLRADADGQSVRVSGDNAYAIYHALSVESPNRILRNPPEDPADLVLDYGDGSTLRLWSIRKNGQIQATGISLLFEAADGRRFLFELKSANLYPLKQWAALSANKPWLG